MKRKSRNLILIAATVALTVAAVGAWTTLWPGRPNVDDAVPALRFPRISPDYSGSIIPPNIAPLNFVVRESGSGFFVRIHSEAGEPIEIHGRSAKIIIPPHRWRSLLDRNRGKNLLFDVYAQSGSRWRRYKTLTNRIAAEDIDGHIAYRLIKPLYNRWHRVGVYQRDLTTYKESAILDGASFNNGCVNCHSFANNDPGRMFIGTRSGTFGSATILASGGKTEKIGTKFGYTAWHPSGRLAAYSINKVRMFFHIAGAQVRDVVDMDAGLAYYDVEERNVKMISRAADKQRLETYPAWSPDGRYLYYCSAPILWKDRNTVPPPRYKEVRYDLMRISYDIKTGRWGSPQTVLPARETGLSILMPRISPDGKFLLFCMCRYGCFPIYQPTSDLYMMELATRKYRKLDINSELSESWHSWSSNSRWIAFSSRRRGGIFTRCYISYVDRTGRAHKPFILPQSDPEFYDSFLKTFSVPELITGPAPITGEALSRAVRHGDPITVDAITGASPPSGALDSYLQTGR